MVLSSHSSIIFRPGPFLAHLLQWMWIIFLLFSCRSIDFSPSYEQKRHRKDWDEGNFVSEPKTWHNPHSSKGTKKVLRLIFQQQVTDSFSSRLYHHTYRSVAIVCGRFIHCWKKKYFMLQCGRICINSIEWDIIKFNIEDIYKRTHSSSSISAFSLNEWPSIKCSLNKLK